MQELHGSGNLEENPFGCMLNIVASILWPDLLSFWNSNVRDSLSFMYQICFVFFGIFFLDLTKLTSLHHQINI